MNAGYPSSKTVGCVSALFYLFVAALDIGVWVGRVNTDANIIVVPTCPVDLSVGAASSQR